MWLSVPKQSRMINLSLYLSVNIITVNEEKGLYELCAYKNDSSFAERLSSPCSLTHAKNQLSNILRSLSHGAAVCRVYDEDDTDDLNDT